VAWCPSSSRPGWLGAVRQRSVLLWDAAKEQVCGNLESGERQQRSLTDLHWGTLLVTGSMDGSVCVHDERDLRKFAAVFNTRTIGHTQVRAKRPRSPRASASPALAPPARSDLSPISHAPKD